MPVSLVDLQALSLGANSRLTRTLVNGGNQKRQYEEPKFLLGGIGFLRADIPRTKNTQAFKNRGIYRQKIYPSAATLKLGR